MLKCLFISFVCFLVELFIYLYLFLLSCEFFFIPSSSSLFPPSFFFLFFLCPDLLRYYWHIALYKCKKYSLIIWCAYISKNNYHSKNNTIIWSSKLNSGYISKGSWRDIYIFMFIAVLFTYTHILWNIIQPCIKGENSANFWWCEISQKNLYCVISLTFEIWKTKLIKAEQNSDCQGLGHERNGGISVKGYKLTDKR